METRLIGKIVSRRFRIEEVIGRGGMSLVYRAFDLKSHQPVAVKVLREEYEDDPEYKERFEREAEVCRRLNHPNIVNMISSGTAGGISYITMEYVDGQTLKEIIHDRVSLPQEEAVHYALQILAALNQAHARGVIHRDIKPQNMLITKNGQLKVTDFGIAGMADTKTLTNDGTVIGSVHYFSPEQAKGMKATASSDLYSVGIILYEMLTGHVPFEGDTPVSVAMMHLMQEAKPVEEQAQVSPALAAIVKKSLKKPVQERYQSAEEMTRDLRRALRHPDGAFMETQWQKSQQNKNEHSAFSVSPALVAVAFVLLVAVSFTGYRLYQTLFVMTRVPDMMGLDTFTAEKMLTSSDLVADISYVYDDAAEGIIISQMPKADAEAKRGSHIVLTVSLGNGIINIPRFTNYTLNEALDIAATQGFIVKSTEIVPSEILKGTVIAQNPEAGMPGAAGAEITLIISGGRVIVPELSGIREEDALQRIQEVGLSEGAVLYENVSSARQDGIVLTQSLDTFSEVLPGTAVDLTIGYYEKRKYQAVIDVDLRNVPSGTAVRITLVDDDGQEYDMYAAETRKENSVIPVTLRSETSGAKTWRLYLDGNFKSEAQAVLR